MIAPSMFTVYLIHSHKFGFVAMTRLENVLLARGYDVWICYFAVALFVFAVGVLADVPRRMLLKIWKAGRK